MEPFLHGAATFLHGFTFAGHPVSCAVALANLDVFEREQLLRARPRQRGRVPRRCSRRCCDLPIVGDVRGAGYFYGDRARQGQGHQADLQRTTSPSGCCAASSPAQLFERGLICRADDRGDPVVQLSPPLIAGPEQFAEIEAVLRPVLTEASEMVQRWSSPSKA